MARQMNLDQFTDEQIRAELERRQKKANKPPDMIENPDFSKVKEMVMAQTESLRAGKYCKYGQEIWEAVLEAYYGRNYWDWHSEMMG
jgi:hypothetical protein